MSRSDANGKWHCGWVHKKGHCCFTRITYTRIHIHTYTCTNFIICVMGKRSNLSGPMSFEALGMIEENNGLFVSITLIIFLVSETV